MKPRREISDKYVLGTRGPCGKFGYTNKKDAKVTLRKLRVHDAYYSKPGELNIYRCWKCNQWHIGHSNP